MCLPRGAHKGRPYGLAARRPRCNVGRRPGFRVKLRKMRFTSLRAVILVALGFWLPSERGKAFEPSAAYQGANAEQTRTASPSKTSKAGAGSSEFFGRAKDLFAKGSLEEARQVARQGLALDPKNPVGYRLLGMIDVQEKDFSRAETAFKKSLELGPRSAEARIQAAITSRIFCFS